MRSSEYNANLSGLQARVFPLAWFATGKKPMATAYQLAPFAGQAGADPASTDRHHGSSFQGERPSSLIKTSVKRPNNSLERTGDSPNLASQHWYQRY